MVFERGLAKKGSYELMEGGLSEYQEINSSSSYCVPAKKSIQTGSNKTSGTRGTSEENNKAQSSDNL